jgi:outer membrane lipoprotein-sorting protein
MNNKKKLVCGALFFAAIFVQGVFLYAQSAEEIVSASRDRIKADSIYSKSTMVLKAKNGTLSTRVIRQFSKDGPKGSRVVVEFLAPESQKGTRFLTMENPGHADDSWIFQPARGKTQRIGAADGSKSFVGTDLSYDDISSANRDVDLDIHSLLREETLGNKPCYVIQSVPKDKSYQYSKMIQWIDKDTKVTQKIELYDQKNILVKTMEILKLEDKNGRLTPMETRMSTHAAGTSTQINVDEISYDDNRIVVEGIFTEAFLSSGRPPR